MIQISKEVLLQVQKDGITYKNLAKDMATVILENLMNDQFSSGEIIEMIQYGYGNDINNASDRDVAKQWYKEFNIPVVCEQASRTVRTKEGGSVAVARFKVFPHEE